jgi:L-cystine uptake protein TcyP (sodium:dicarboxylate symporter family)
MKKGMTKYIILNLMAPGIGQLALKKIVRGTLQFSASVFAVLWLVVVFGNEVRTIWDHAVNGGDITMHWRRFLYPTLLLTLTWILSFIDLLLFCSPPEREPPPLPSERSHSASERLK